MTLYLRGTFKLCVPLPLDLMKDLFCHCEAVHSACRRFKPAFSLLTFVRGSQPFVYQFGTIKQLRGLRLPISLQRSSL